MMVLLLLLLLLPLLLLLLLLCLCGCLACGRLDRRLLAQRVAAVDGRHARQHINHRLGVWLDLMCCRELPLRLVAHSHRFRFCRCNPRLGRRLMLLLLLLLLLLPLLLLRWWCI